MSNHREIFKDLVDKMANSDSESAYKQLFFLLYKPILNFSLGILKSRPLAEEITSDVLFKLWEHRRKLSEVSNPRYYVFVTAKHMALNLLKKQKNTTVSLDEIDLDLWHYTETPESAMVQHDIRAAISHCVAELPLQCRNVFRLVKIEGFTYQEAADLLGISVKTVDAQMVKAIKRLGQSLRPYWNLYYSKY